MRFESNAKEHQDSLPTFIQWCKTQKDSQTAETYFVTKVWLPNKFPDLTLETETFRLRISHKSRLFESLMECLPSWELNGTALLVSEIEKETFDFTLEVSEVENADWEPLGDTGRKLTIRERKKTSRRKKT